MEDNLIISSIDDITIDFDNANPKLCGIPLIKMGQLGLSVQFLPITKIQFEYFLCDQPDPDLNEAVYNEILSENARGSLHNITIENYRQLFLTGIKPKELEKYCLWMGENFATPTLQEWLSIYDVLQQATEISVAKKIVEQKLSTVRSSIILENLDNINKKIVGSDGPRSICDQIFMRHGIQEWVKDEGSPSGWNLMGGKTTITRYPAKVLIFSLDMRDGELGFRLIRHDKKQR